LNRRVQVRIRGDFSDETEGQIQAIVDGSAPAPADIDSPRINPN
jgi:hypothetical protein